MEFTCFFRVRENNEYTCHLQLKVDENTVNNVSNVHVKGKTNENVVRVEIISQKLKSFPRQVIMMFTKVVVLKVMYCELETISREDLKGFENLQKLDLLGNNLTHLPDDLFLDLKHLRMFSFACNKLRCLSSKLLIPIQDNLEYANFNNNPNIDVSYTTTSTCSTSLKQLKDAMDKLSPTVINIESQNLQKIDFNVSEYSFTLSDILSENNALEVFNLVTVNHPLKAAAFKMLQKKYTGIPESLINKKEEVNQLIEAKRQIEFILAAGKKFSSQNSQNLRFLFRERSFEERLIAKIMIKTTRAAVQQ